MKRFVSFQLTPSRLFKFLPTVASIVKDLLAVSSFYKLRCYKWKVLKAEGSNSSQTNRCYELLTDISKVSKVKIKVPWYVKAIMSMSINRPFFAR